MHHHLLDPFVQSRGSVSATGRWAENWPTRISTPHLMIVRCVFELWPDPLFPLRFTPSAGHWSSVSAATRGVLPVASALTMNVHRVRPLVAGPSVGGVRCGSGRVRGVA